MQCVENCYEKIAKQKIGGIRVTDWKPFTLKEITTKIGSGSTPKGGKEAYHEIGITLVRSLNVYDFVFDKNDNIIVELFPDFFGQHLDSVFVLPRRSDVNSFHFFYALVCTQKPGDLSRPGAC